MTDIEWKDIRKPNHCPKWTGEEDFWTKTELIFKKKDGMSPDESLRESVKSDKVAFLDIDKEETRALLTIAWLGATVGVEIDNKNVDEVRDMGTTLLNLLYDCHDRESANRKLSSVTDTIISPPPYTP